MSSRTSPVIIALIVGVGMAAGCGWPKFQQAASRTKATTSPTDGTAPAPAPSQPTRPVETAPRITVVRDLPAAVHGLVAQRKEHVLFADTFGKLASDRQVYLVGKPASDFTASRLDVQMPAGMASDPTRGLYLCDVRGGTVTRIHREPLPGGKRKYSVWKVSKPWNVATRLGRTFAVLDGGDLVELNDDGTTRVVKTGLDAPFDLAIAVDGIWVTEQGVKDGRVRRFDFHGKELARVSPRPANPEGIAIDARGRPWFVDTEKGTLNLINASGGFTVVRDGLTLPIALTASPEGTLYFNTGGKTPRLWRVDIPVPGRYDGEPQCKAHPDVKTPAAVPFGVASCEGSDREGLPNGQQTSIEQALTQRFEQLYDHVLPNDSLAVDFQCDVLTGTPKVAWLQTAFFDRLRLVKFEARPDGVQVRLIHLQKGGDKASSIETWSTPDRLTSPADKAAFRTALHTARIALTTQLSVVPLGIERPGTSSSMYSANAMALGASGGFVALARGWAGNESSKLSAHRLPVRVAMQTMSRFAKGRLVKQTAIDKQRYLHGHDLVEHFSQLEANGEAWPQVAEAMVEVAVKLGNTRLLPALLRYVNGPHVTTRGRAAALSALRRITEWPHGANGRTDAEQIAELTRTCGPGSRGTVWVHAL